MPEVADIFGRYGPEYLQRFGSDLLPSHRRALEDIQNCRTPALGGQVYTCDQCGHLEYSYHSCRNRSCPKCHAHDTEQWLAVRRKDLLAIPYFHVVFTLPEELRTLVRSHQKVLYGLLMKSAAESLIKLAGDPHYVGGLIGILAVLHTWTRTLVYHPHVHCLVPGGGVSQQNEWRPARKDYLVPVKALSKIFRGIFRDGLAQMLPQANVPSNVWRKKWVVYCKPTVQGADQVLAYLGRYVHRIAIPNSRIVSIEDGNVTFRYQEVDGLPWLLKHPPLCPPRSNPSRRHLPASTAGKAGPVLAVGRGAWSGNVACSGSRGRPHDRPRRLGSCRHGQRLFGADAPHRSSGESLSLPMSCDTLCLHPNPSGAFSAVWTSAIPAISSPRPPSHRPSSLPRHSLAKVKSPSATHPRFSPTKFLRRLRGAKTLVSFQWGYKFHPRRNVDPLAAGFRIPRLPFPAGAGSTGGQRPAGARLDVSKALGHSTVRGFRVEEKPTKSTTGAQPGQAVKRGRLASVRHLGDNPPTAEG